MPVQRAGICTILLPPWCAGVAQSVEQFTRNEKVGGSIPLSGTIKPSLNTNKILNIKGNQAEKNTFNLPSYLPIAICILVRLKVIY